MMKTWGVVVRYMLRTLGALDNVEGTFYRGFPRRTARRCSRSIRRRPIQWGAFTSVTSSLEAAKRFAGPGGVVCRIDVSSGKDICPISFYECEKEILLSPNHRFIVTSETGGYEHDGQTFLDLLQQEGGWVNS